MSKGRVGSNAGSPLFLRRLPGCRTIFTGSINVQDNFSADFVDRSAARWQSEDQRGRRRYQPGSFRVGANQKMTFVFVFLLISLSGAVAYLAARLFDVKKRNDVVEAELEEKEREYAEKDQRYDSHVRQTTTQISTLRTRVQALSKWQGVANAELKAQELVRDAQHEADRQKTATQEWIEQQQRIAHGIVTRAQMEGDQIRLEAFEKAAKLKRDAAVTVADANAAADATRKAALDAAETARLENAAGIENARLRAAEIVRVAEQRAMDIAGEALAAKRNADTFERTAKAMQNIIKGYGNEYLIPPQSLLDDLAESVGHTEAGQELKRSRDHSRKMVKFRTAGQCAYVETSRRDTAIDFVVDAFNGKADSILSRVKSDNAGTLQQELRDAFLTVNYNGRAFRDALITEDYLTSRLDELKWGAIAHQLKTEEREEQKRIKDQLREEERARREYERTIRETAREEEVIRKAMEKARAELEHATTQQRAAYERQLEELNLKLQEAESRNQRALSMAQQTKRGHVYVISNIGSFGEHVYKIGMTRRLDPLDRIRELGDASVPFEFDVHALMFSDDAPALESQLHKHFLLKQINKVNHRKEFFRVTLAHIREEVEELGLSVNWTMAAAARQFRESQAIEKAIEENPAQREAWLQRQLQLELLDEVYPELEEIEEGASS